MLGFQGAQQTASHFPTQTRDQLRETKGREREERGRTQAGCDENATIVTAVWKARLWSGVCGACQVPLPPPAASLRMGTGLSLPQAQHRAEQPLQRGKSRRALHAWCFHPDQPEESLLCPSGGQWGKEGAETVAPFWVLSVSHCWHCGQDKSLPWDGPGCCRVWQHPGFSPLDAGSTPFPWL